MVAKIAIPLYAEHLHLLISKCGWQVTLLCLIVVGSYIAFFQIFHSQNIFIMTLLFYQNVKLGPTPTFYYQPPPPLPSPLPPTLY